MTNNRNEFIKELEAISRKYGLKIDGCGCCGSPDIVELKEAELDDKAGYIYYHNLRWISEDDYVVWEGHKDRIVK